MDYKEKYEEVLERAKLAIKECGNNKGRISMIESIFPELRESDVEKTKRILHSISSKMSFHLHDIFTEEEFQCFDNWSNAWLKTQGSKESKDEKIRKNLIEFLDSIWHLGKDANFDKWGKADCSDWIDYLEKQGESDETKIKMFLINKGYPIDANGIFPTYEEMYDIIKEGLEKQDESIKIKKGKNYLCTKTHKYADVEWIEGIKYYSPEDYSLVNQGCTYHCPKYSKEEHNDFFKEVKYDGCLEVNTIGPKFHEGDWIACRDLNTAKITGIDDDKYEVEFIDGSKGFPHIDYVDRNFHLWTIEDAEDGDMLTTLNYIYIFNSIDEETETVAYYGLMKISNEHFIFGDYKIHDEILNSVPATKEQRNIMLNAIKEAGYEWNQEAKELKKIDEAMRKDH